MIYTHRFRVQAPLAAVAGFHQRPESMAAITPPPILVQIHQAPTMLRTGDLMHFTMWFGPLPVRWLARIEGAEVTGFVDSQVRGPFHSWIHKHIFIPIDNTTTDVYDEVTVQLHKRSHFWRIVGYAMWLGMPLLFAYRRWRTRRFLEHSHQEVGT